MSSARGKNARTRFVTPRDDVIVVAPPEVCCAIARSVGRRRPLVVFSSLEELDRWRRVTTSEEPTIYPDLIHALAEMGRTVVALPRRLREVVETMGRATRVPRLSALERAWPSRRSLYRTWREAIAQPPSAFLRRVRALHARRLLASGCSRKEAAHRAGYSSVDQMRRHLGAAALQRGE